MRARLPLPSTRDPHPFPRLAPTRLVVLAAILRLATLLATRRRERIPHTRPLEATLATLLRASLTRLLLAILPRATPRLASLATRPLEARPQATLLLAKPLRTHRRPATRPQAHLLLMPVLLRLATAHLLLMPLPHTLRRKLSLFPRCSLVLVAALLLAHLLLRWQSLFLLLLPLLLRLPRLQQSVLVRYIHSQGKTAAN